MKPYTIRKLTPLNLWSFKKKGWEFYPITYKEEKYFVKIVSCPRLTQYGPHYTVTCQISRYEPLKEFFPGHRGALLHCMDISHLRKVNGDPLNLDLFGSDYSEWNLPLTLWRLSLRCMNPKWRNRKKNATRQSGTVWCGFDKAFSA